MKAVAVKAEVSGEAKALNYMAKCFPMNELRVDWLKKVSIFVFKFVFIGFEMNMHFSGRHVCNRMYHVF